MPLSIYIHGIQLIYLELMVNHFVLMNILVTKIFKNIIEFYKVLSQFFQHNKYFKSIGKKKKKRVSYWFSLLIRENFNHTRLSQGSVRALWKNPLDCNANSWSLFIGCGQWPMRLTSENLCLIFFFFFGYLMFFNNSLE